MPSSSFADGLQKAFGEKIAETVIAEDRLDRRLNGPARLDLFGVFESPTTPLDRKSDFALTTGYIGIGRRETEWLTWNFYFGSGVGGDRDHQRWARFLVRGFFRRPAGGGLDRAG